MAVAIAGRAGLNRNRFWKIRFFGKWRSFEFRLQRSIFGLKLSEGETSREKLVRDAGFPWRAIGR